jgi:protein-tyrosine phosphatase
MSFVFFLSCSSRANWLVSAMGVPAVGKEAAYRNPENDVAKFMKQYHEGHFLILNLSGREYHYEKFDNRVVDFHWKDHYPPSLRLLFRICETIDTYLMADEQNVVAVHCLAGKGRTGVAVAAYLLFNKQCETAEEALEFFNSRRVSKGSGIKQPSHKRYVAYFEAALHNKIELGPPMRLETVVMSSVPSFDTRTGGCCPVLEIYKDDALLYTSAHGDGEIFEFTPNAHSIVVFRVNTDLQGDVMLKLVHIVAKKMKKDHQHTKTRDICWTHLNFDVQEEGTIHLEREDLDGITPEDHRFPSSFSLDVSIRKSNKMAFTGDGHLSFVAPTCESPTPHREGWWENLSLAEPRRSIDRKQLLPASPKMKCLIPPASSPLVTAALYVAPVPRPKPSALSTAVSSQVSHSAKEDKEVKEVKEVKEDKEATGSKQRREMVEGADNDSDPDESDDEPVSGERRRISTRNYQPSLQDELSENGNSRLEGTGTSSSSFSSSAQQQTQQQTAHLHLLQKLIRSGDPKPDRRPPPPPPQRSPGGRDKTKTGAAPILSPTSTSTTGEKEEEKEKENAEEYQYQQQVQQVLRQNANHSNTLGRRRTCPVPPPQAVAALQQRHLQLQLQRAEQQQQVEQQRQALGQQLLGGGVSTTPPIDSRPSPKPLPRRSVSLYEGILQGAMERNAMAAALSRPGETVHANGKDGEEEERNDVQENENADSLSPASSATSSQFATPTAMTPPLTGASAPLPPRRLPPKPLIPPRPPAPPPRRQLTEPALSPTTPEP